MGFPVGYTELMLPKFLLHVVFLLGYLRRLITWAFDLFGLADLLLDPSDITPTTTTTTTTTYSTSHSHHHHRRQPNTTTTTYSTSHSHHHHRRQPNTTTKPLYAILIQEALPVTSYEHSPETTESCCCAVCLHEFSRGEEVRRLSNCRHVFHRCCLDPWVELDQRTCPLCRAPLIPDRIKDDVYRKLEETTDSNGLQSSGSYFYYDNYSDGGDFYDESFGFMLPSQAEPFPWPSTAVPL